MDDLVAKPDYGAPRYGAVRGLEVITKIGSGFADDPELA